MLSKFNRKFSCKIEELTLFVDDKKVNLNEFVFNYDEHYTASEFGLLLLCKLRVVAKWKEGGKRKNKDFIIEEGFEWDGASIPDLFQNIIGKPKDPAFALASCIHDKLVNMGLSHYIESRIFYEILKTRSGKFDIPWYKEKAMYVAVYAWSIWTA